jgi:hypothetical protein
MMSSSNSLRQRGNGKKEQRVEVFGKAAREAMQRAVAEAVADHHRAGNPVAVWQDGQVVMLYPDGSTRPVEKEAAASSPE